MNFTETSNHFPPVHVLKKKELQLLLVGNQAEEGMLVDQVTMQNLLLILKSITLPVVAPFW
uniref:Uncharacterized protein n=1 Tax=Aegilops tauschii subsp. strangulata TaxID=200361 RepID=A0A453SEP8_AEGTS